MSDLATATMPAFLNPDDAARVAHSALRRRLLDGSWGDDATTRHQQFFSAETHVYLPPPELSHNAMLLFTDAKSTLYDEAPKTEAKGAADLSVVITPELWPLAQENLRLVNALNDGFMRVDVIGGRISYRVVPADCVGDVVTAPGRPDRPVCLTEIRPRSRMVGDTMVSEYTLETWDLRDPANPVFKIEVDVIDPNDKTRRTRLDVTEAYNRDAEGNPSAAYPYREDKGKGAPIFPYAKYAAKVGNTVWNAWAGMEVVEGTLNASALWTMWMMGVRDGAHPQRYTIDLDVDGMKTSNVTAPASGYVEMIPTAILRFKSKGDRNGTAGQFEPAMQPGDMGEAISNYEAALARFAGIDAPDVQRSSASSGYALVVSQDGKRKAQQRLEAPCRMGDLYLLTRAAKLANAYLAASLPENEADWTIAYSKGRRSIEEVKAAYEEAKAKMEMGIWDEVDVMIALNPEMDRTQALAKVLDVIQTSQLIEAARRAALPEPAGTEVVAEPGADATEPAPVVTDTKISDTAFTGIQIEKLAQLLAAISDGTGSAEVTKLIMGQAFPSIGADVAEAMIAAAKRFTPPAPVVV